MPAPTPAPKPARFYAALADTLADLNGEGVLATVVHVTEMDARPAPAYPEIANFLARLGAAVAELAPGAGKATPALGLGAGAAPAPAPAATPAFIDGFIAAIAAGANRSPAQVTAILNAFATSRVRGCRAVCGRVPLCRQCRLRPRCDHGNRPRPETAPSPLERLQKGMDLTAEEALSLALGDGADDRKAAAAVLAFFNGSLARASDADYSELAGLRGVGPKRAARLAAIGRLHRAAAQEKRDRAPEMHCAADFFEYYRRRLGGRPTESLLIILLDQRHQIIRDEEVSRGAVNVLAFTPGEALSPAVREHVANVAFVHNHPSGDCTPSGADREGTRRLADAAKILGIHVLDHLIIGGDKYYSFAEHGEI